MRRTAFSIVCLLVCATARGASAGEPVASPALAPAPVTTPANETAAPALTFAPARLDFGRRLQKQSVQKTVTVRNNSLDTLKISKVSADCGCTVPRLDSEHLAPGESTTLTVLFETRGYLGEIHRTVTLDTSAGVFALPLSVTVAQHENWDVTPSPTTMRPSYSDRPAKLEVVARSRSAGTPATLTTGSASVPWIDVSVGPLSKGTQTITLFKKTDASPGTHTVFVTLKSDSATDQPLVLQVTVPVAPTITATPSPILLPASKPGVEVSATFRIIGWKETALPTAQSELGRVEYVREISGEHEFRLTFKPGAPEDAIGSVLILNGKKTELEITFVQRVAIPETSPAPASP